VREGSTLLGSGSLLGALVVEGRLNPGNSAGLFTVAGPVLFAPGSIAAFDIDGTGIGNGPGNYSRLVSASTVTIQGGSLVPILRGITGEATNTFTPALGQRFQVISAQGQIVGSFSGLQQPAGLPNGYAFDTLYSSNALELVVTAADFAQLTALGVGPTPNRIRTGAAIQAIRPLAGTRNPNPDTALFFRELYSSDAAGITRALDQIGTAIHGQVLDGSLSSWRQSAKSATRPRHSEELFWLDMAGHVVRSTGDGRVRGHTLHSAGALLGADLWRRPGRLAGVAFGIAEGRLSSSGPDMARASLESQQALAYAQYKQGAWRFGATGGLGWSQANVERRLSVGNFSHKIQSTPDIKAADISIELSRQMQVGAIGLSPGIFMHSEVALN